LRLYVKRGLGVAKETMLMAAKWLGAALLTALLCLQAHGQEVKAGGITILTPWARATPGGAKVGGAYLEIKAAQGAADRLVAAKSPLAGKVEIHEHVHEGDVMKMRRVEGVAVAGGQSVIFKPGGYHLMLMDLTHGLKQGEKLPLTLVFEKAGEVNVEATIAPIGAMGPGAKSSAPAAASGPPVKASSGAHKH
jgi:copper(I)-binding protein